ncbi:MAG: ATP-binding protein [Terriglobales bacterium]
MLRIKQHLVRYSLATVVAVAALVLRGLLNPLLGRQNPYHTAWLAIVFCAWYCGIGASVLAVAICGAGIWYWFVAPYHAFDGAALFGMLGFLVFSIVIIALGESTRRIAGKRERAEEELRKAQHDLERRVGERTAALEQKTSEVIEKAALLDLANDAIFVKAANGTISYWNRGAERLYGWTAAQALGCLPRELLRTEYPLPLSEIESSDSWEGELRHTKRDGTRIVVSSRWTTLRDVDGNAVGWLEINTDITARKRAEDAARSLSGRILTLQDEERRRLARGLHDSLGQYLAALKMNLDRIPNSDGNNAALASECSEIVQKCLTETRTISHLLHPPLLDESGFASAARWCVEGFAQRSGIKANLDLPAELGRLNKDVEIALFRAVQEALTNVHRHSGGSEVDIRVTLNAKQVRLEIKDNGQGIPQERLRGLTEGYAEAGVGIAGMRERMRELGGSLEIQSKGTGTKVIIAIPLREKVLTQSTNEADSKQIVSAA